MRHNTVSTLIQIMQNTEHLPSHSFLPKLVKQAILPHGWEGLISINKQHICILLLQLPASQNLIQHELVVRTAALRPEPVLAFMQQRRLLLLLLGLPMTLKVLLGLLGLAALLVLLRCRGLLLQLLRLLLLQLLLLWLAVLGCRGLLLLLWGLLLGAVLPAQSLHCGKGSLACPGKALC